MEFLFIVTRLKVFRSNMVEDDPNFDLSAKKKKKKKKASTMILSSIILYIQIRSLCF
jgi:hypothetical protein